MVGILILNYNNDNDIRECIDSLVRHVDLESIKLQVVDNGSRETIYHNVGSYLRAKFAKVQELSIDNVVSKLRQISYLRLSQNLGYARGNNEGLKYFYNDPDINYILILNSDIIITENFIPLLKKYIAQHESVAVVSPLLLKRNGDVDYCCARRALSKSDMLKTFSYVFNKKYIRALNRQMILRDSSVLLGDSIVTEFPSGSCMMFRKSILQKIESFDPNTFLYYEEHILYRKIQKLGMKSVLIPSVSCIHTGGATTNSVKTPFFLKKCNLDSLLYCLKTYEDCSELGLLYVRMTGAMRLFRLWIAEKYKKYLKR